MVDSEQYLTDPLCSFFHFHKNPNKNVIQKILTQNFLQFLYVKKEAEHMDLS